MQTQSQATPTPTAPQAPRPTQIQIEAGPGSAPQTISVPLSMGEIRELRARRSELSDQLTRAQNRRANVVSSLEGADGANRAGLEERLTVLDERIVQLEAEIAATERMVASAPAGLLAAAGRYESSGSSGGPDAAIIIPSLLTIFVGAPIAFAYARRIIKRPHPVKVNSAEVARLERIEQAVEAIAVEVERVSEGQRFVTKLLSDTGRAPLRLPAER